MKWSPLPGVAACLAALLVFPFLALAQNTPTTGSGTGAPPASGKPGEVTKLDGTKVFGIIEITDDYTIRITTDTGITKLPLAALSEGDFEKFTKGKDRSQDGKLWSDRKDALTAQQNKPGGDTSAIEIPLGKLAGFQSLIDSYQKSHPDKGANNPADSAKPPTDASSATSSVPTQKLFSGGPGDTVIGPAMETATSLAKPITSAVGTATGAAGSVPSLPAP